MWACLLLGNTYSVSGRLGIEADLGSGGKGVTRRVAGGAAVEPLCRAVGLATVSSG